MTQFITKAGLTISMNMGFEEERAYLDKLLSEGN
jgi:hypothetical protein